MLTAMLLMAISAGPPHGPHGPPSPHYPPPHVYPVVVPIYPSPVVYPVYPYVRPSIVVDVHPRPRPSPQPQVVVNNEQPANETWMAVGVLAAAALVFVGLSATRDSRF